MRQKWYGKHSKGWTSPFGRLTKKKIRRHMEKESRRRNRG